MMLFQLSDPRCSSLRLKDIFRHCLIPCAVTAIAASCATPSVKDTEESGSTPGAVPSYEEATPDHKTPSPEIDANVGEPITDLPAPYPAEQDFAPVTEPPSQTTVSMTPDSPVLVPVEPASPALVPGESAADRLTSHELPKQDVVVHEKPKVQQPTPSIPKQSVVEPARKRANIEPKHVEPRKEMNKMEVTKTEKTPPEVKLEKESLETDETAVVAMRYESPIDQPGSLEKPVVTAAEPPTVTLESLPMTFGTQWSLDRAPNPITGKTECILTSKSVNIFDGYEQTDVQLYLTSGVIFAKTKSNIDLNYPETGLRVDSSGLRAFEKVAKLTNAVISSDVDGVLASMVPGQQVVVRLGFWPTWPMTSTREVVFQLEGFPEALRALHACEEM